MYLQIYLTINQSINISTYQSINIYLSIYLPINQSINESLSLSLFLSLSPSLPQAVLTLQDRPRSWFYAWCCNLVLRLKYSKQFLNKPKSNESLSSRNKWRQHVCDDQSALYRVQYSCRSGAHSPALDFWTADCKLQTALPFECSISRAAAVHFINTLLTPEMKRVPYSQSITVL